MQRQFVSFTLGGSLLGLDVLLVREIIRSVDITPVSPAPEFVLGLMNLRGQIITVVDLSVRLARERGPLTAQTRCIVLKNNQELEALADEASIAERTCGETVALLVDRVGDLVVVDSSAVEPPPPNANGVDARYVAGVVKLPDGLLATLKAAELLKL
jgi:purine-binding chemotaxis protein CheW